MQPIIDYLRTGHFPASMSKEARKRLAHKAIPYQMIHNRLYRLSKDDRLRQVLIADQSRAILQELHKGNVGGHFSPDITVQKILDAEYWWPTLFRDTVDYCRACHGCQMTGGLPKTVTTKLITQLPAEPFMK